MGLPIGMTMVEIDGGRGRSHPRASDCVGTALIYSSAAIAALPASRGLGVAHLDLLQARLDGKGQRLGH